MKKLLIKLWEKWIRISKEHNKRLLDNGECWEKCWFAIDIFVPILIGIGTTFMCYCFGMMVSLLFSFDYVAVALFLGFIAICISYFHMYFDWKKYYNISLSNKIQ